MKRIKYDPKLPTVPSGQPLSQVELDDIIRKAAAPHAIEEMVSSSVRTQTYLLDNGFLLKVWRRTGKVRICNPRP